MLEWLKTILGEAYTEDVDKKVSEQIGKDFVARADFNAANEAKKTLDGQIKDRDKQLEELKKSSGDSEALKQQIAQLQESNKTAKTEYDASLAKINYDSRAEKFIDGLKPRDDLSKKAILSEFAAKAFKLEGESFIGGKEWAEEFKKANAAHFADGTGFPPPPGGGAPAPSDMSKLSDEDFYAKAFTKK
ncbi:Phage minor structural protein GP20 [Sporobacter termitidis DSM 10068]|uniref:Phage minor structural protein GP20 n=1 Tax=Sporobacter termitidis DSM 10068 TaxID=1123282 RepID=A0A1M5ZJH9_9FIRM|nr:phage scaffolding protein [Sporobacter termitidis]SHI24322.1 Phage minor structural protein GP20 [Sporobacter termitidis DSM 10068]SHI24602.1 Phage minor structural protein GP20 [Sporobacter termitidis DSM 10068]